MINGYPPSKKPKIIVKNLNNLKEEKNKINNINMNNNLNDEELINLMNQMPRGTKNSCEDDYQPEVYNEPVPNCLMHIESNEDEKDNGANIIEDEKDQKKNIRKQNISNKFSRKNKLDTNFTKINKNNKRINSNQKVKININNINNNEIVQLNIKEPESLRPFKNIKKQIDYKEEPLKVTIELLDSNNLYNNNKFIEISHFKTNQNSNEYKSVNKIERKSPQQIKYNKLNNSNNIISLEKKSNKYNNLQYKYIDHRSTSPQNKNSNGLIKKLPKEKLLRSTSNEQKNNNLSNQIFNNGNNNINKSNSKTQNNLINKIFISNKRAIFKINKKNVESFSKSPQKLHYKFYNFKKEYYPSVKKINKINRSPDKNYSYQLLNKFSYINI